MNSSRSSKSRSGFSMIETLVVCGIVALIGLIVTGVWIISIWSFDRTTSQTVADTDAVLAMGHVIADVREAKSVQLLSPHHLRIIFPVRETDGSYNRILADTAHPVDYVQTDSSGTPGRTGANTTWLWRVQTGGTSRPVARDLEPLSASDPTKGVVFESDTPRSVRITIATLSPYARGNARTSLTERVVYLRNY